MMKLQRLFVLILAVTAMMGCSKKNLQAGAPDPSIQGVWLAQQCWPAWDNPMEGTRLRLTIDAKNFLAEDVRYFDQTCAPGQEMGTEFPESTDYVVQGPSPVVQGAKFIGFYEDISGFSQPYEIYKISGSNLNFGGGTDANVQLNMSVTYTRQK